jgi:hypothetical protein
MEEWRDIEGYEGLYQVSNEGRVKSLDRVIDAYNYNANKNISYVKKGRILKQGLDKDGYSLVNLCRNSEDHKTCKVHRLVAKAFIPNPNNYLEINHKDECKTNNVVENLEWCDHSYNNTYLDKNVRGGLTRIKNGNTKKVYQLTLDGKLINVFKSSREAERISDYNHSSICNCINGRTKTYKGYLWRYV